MNDLIRATLLAMLLIATTVRVAPPATLHQDALLEAAKKTFNSAVGEARKDYETAVRAAAAKYRRALESQRPKPPSPGPSVDDYLRSLASIEIEEARCDRYAMGWSAMAYQFVADANYEVVEFGKVVATLRLRSDGTFVNAAASPSAEALGSWNSEGDFINLDWKSGERKAGALQAFMPGGDLVVRRVPR